MIASVTALVIDNDGKILMVSRKYDPTMFGLVGGKVDPGESPEDAVSREFHEETGAYFTPLNMIHSDVCGFDYICIGSPDTVCDFKVDGLPSGTKFKATITNGMIETENLGHVSILLNSRDAHPISGPTLIPADDVLYFGNDRQSLWRIPSARLIGEVMEFMNSKESYNMTFVGVMHGTPHQVEVGVNVVWGDADALYKGPFASYNRAMLDAYSRFMESGIAKTPTAYQKLAPYQRHEGPFLAADCIIYFPDEEEIVVIDRKYEPYGYAIPGGHADYGETLEDAALREAMEEVGMTINDALAIWHVGHYDAVDRDPRKHVVSHVYAVVARPEFSPVAADDAKSFKRISIHDAEAINKLAFDHKQILADFTRTPEFAALLNR